MSRSPAAHPWTAPRTSDGRPAPILYRAHGAPTRPTLPHAEHSALPTVATLLTLDERLRVDAAGQGVYATRHFDDAQELSGALQARPFGAVLVSVAMLAPHQGRATSAVVELLRERSALPVAALVSDGVELATVLALGHAGIRSVVDVRRPEGWADLRATLACAARPDVAQLAARALAPLLTDATGDVQRFVAALFAAPAQVVTVRDLARGLGVLPTTLMSRFFRAALPPPKRYLAFARLTRAAYLLHTQGWTVAGVADHLEYSSAQGFSRHLHLLLGIRPAEFRRQYDTHAMLARFGSELLAPHANVLHTFWPLRHGEPAAHPAVHRPKAHRASTRESTPTTLPGPHPTK